MLDYIYTQLFGLKNVGREIRFSPRLLPDFYEKYQTFTGQRYNSSNFMKVHFMEAYMTGVDALGLMEVQRVHVRQQLKKSCVNRRCSRIHNLQ